MSGSSETTRLPRLGWKRGLVASGDYIDDNLYLTFAADSACVEDFLLSNHLTRGSTVTRADVAEFRDDKQRAWRWYEDSADSYRRFRNRPLPGTELTVEVTTDGSPRRVHLRGVEF
ncbi:hypothetical protein [Micromonospora avicenniae]|uniref:hypothetical protein n=1 Tax=Micromonospora avicenniae TaxID=1198245 RepID=UPI00341E78FF